MQFDFLFVQENGEQCGPDSFAEDLSLAILLDAMADGDQQIGDACRRIILRPLTDTDSIDARRGVMADAERHFAMFGAWLSSARDAMKRADTYAEFQHPRYDRVIPNQKKLITEAEIAGFYLRCFGQIAASAADGQEPFQSKAVARFTAEVRRRYSAENLAAAEARLKQINHLKQSENVVLSAAVGAGLKPADAVLNAICASGGSRRTRNRKKEIAIPLSNTCLVQNTDEVIQSAMAVLLRTMERFNKNSRLFLDRLHFQMCFYVGCIRLKKKLTALGIPLCMPVFCESGAFTGRALMNPCLALHHKSVPVGNDLCFTDKRLVIVTGDNQGGKTTFLRSVGLAQLMAQCGMYVTAQQYQSPVFSCIFTHFPSHEDTSHEAGLLDMELEKLSRIVDAIKPRGLLLMNESFQSTMPADAGYIAESTVRALCDADIRVVFVTHLYAYASALYARRDPHTLFLRARRTAGDTAFRIREGEPAASASGTRILDEVFET